MNLDPKKFSEDSTRSNPYVAAMMYEDCPLNKTNTALRQCCFMIAVGGSILNQCMYFHEDGRTPMCKRD